jgi:short-subunit dehydrogenase
MNIQGKTAWITGASSGIGEALATELFNQGAKVILSARNIPKLNEIKDRFDKITPGRCLVIECDVTRPDSVSKAANEVTSKVDRLDILINNAGVSQRSWMLETSMEVERQLFEVNFFGAAGITKAILPWMISKGGGHIVVISSMAGKYGFRMRSSYSASKHALQGYFETLRAEVHEQHVGVTIVCPGRIKTDISINSLTADGRKYGIMDAGQQNGVPVERCARIIVSAIKNNRKEVFIGSAERFLLLVKRICPLLYYAIVNRASPT